MKVLFCTSACVPYAASGGLGDVAGSLPKALVKEGVDCRVVLPLYRKTRDNYGSQMTYMTNFYVTLGWRNLYCGVFKLEKDGVTYYFLDNEFYFNRDSLYSYFDDGERFAFFSKAILEMLVNIDFAPDIIHCNDWQTALTTVYINAYYRGVEKLARTKTIFTIHNIQYQGQYGKNLIEDVLSVPGAFKGVLEYNRDTNYMKAALECADKITTVSPTYAAQILDPWYSHKLDPVLRGLQFKLCGILNGIDYDGYNPRTDAGIAKTFTPDTIKEGKAACKKELIDRFNLADDGSPIISMVTRLVEHKGLDIVRECMEGLVNAGYEVVVLGSGEYMYEEFFKYLRGKYPGRVGVEIGFVPALARKIYAGSDMFLMPSKSEPCGLSQMIALRYGTIPIVRETGGLKDSVHDSLDGKGNGFTFAGYSSGELYDCCMRAFNGYKDKEGWEILAKRAMESDNSWTNSAKEYIKLYEDTVNLW